MKRCCRPGPGLQQVPSSITKNIVHSKRCELYQTYCRVMAKRRRADACSISSDCCCSRRSSASSCAGGPALTMCSPPAVHLAHVKKSRSLSATSDRAEAAAAVRLSSAATWVEDASARRPHEALAQEPSYTGEKTRGPRLLFDFRTRCL